MTKAILLYGRGALIWVLCLMVALASWRFMVGGVEQTMGFVAYHAQLRPIAFYAHVVFAPIALALVPFQLWRGFRERHGAIHRLLGRIYGMTVLLSGLGGLWMAATTTAGPIAALGFGLLAVLWLGTTVTGIRYAMRGDYHSHRQWMIRSIALTLSAVTLRLYLPVPLATGLDFASAYAAIAWLCWVPNLLIAEYLIGQQRERVAG